MVRTVSISSASGKPLWYEQACEILGLPTGSVSTRTGSSATELPPRTAQRFARLARFLQESYPDLLNAGNPMLAGSAAVLELAKIHAVSRSEADALAARCLSGEIGVAELRERFESLQSQHAGTAPPVRKTSSQRAAAFADVASGLILSGEVKLPTELEVVQIMRPDRREPMAPDLIAYGKAPGQVIAVEIKSPSDRSARSPFQTATELMERMALLKLHFLDAVLVMPKEAKEIADMTEARWNDWVKNLSGQSRKMHLLLVEHSVEGRQAADTEPQPLEHR